jgi:hypothetical protein
MTVNPSPIRLRLTGVSILATLWLLAAAASADCAKDRNGEVYCGGGQCLPDKDGTVWCSRHWVGDAMKTRDGRVLCGKGECEKDKRGEIFCSSERGGAVLKDSEGRVRCYGQCERASAEQCENTRADSSD